MSKQKIKIIKSPLVPSGFSSDDMIVYTNQITYSVRLSNGMIVSRPEEFPNGNETQDDVSKIEETPAEEC